MMIIDSQVHAYERNHPGRSWAGFLTGPDEVTGDAMVAAMEAVGVAGAVLVSPFSLYGYDASYALDVMDSIDLKFSQWLRTHKGAVNFKTPHKGLEKMFNGEHGQPHTELKY